MGWNNQNVTSLLIINASGGFTGLFVYNPSPGPGNLIDSIAAQAGTDPYGNPYLQGISAYGSVGAGVSQVNAQCWGPSGGSSGNRTTDSTGGSSGGGGEFASQVVAVTPGNTYTVVVGTGGSAGVAGGAPGGTGTNTTFTGDSATVTAHSGTGGVEAPAAGGLGGTGSTNTVHHDGGAGAAGSGVSGSAGGGSSAGPGAPGNPGTVNAGGIAPAGGGNGANGFPTGDHPGAAGSAPGGGPSGPLASTFNFNGIAGTAGQVVLTWAGGSQTFATPGTFTWTAPVGTQADININVVASALSLFFHTGAPSDAGPGAHFFSTVFNAGTLAEVIELAIIGPTSTGSPGRVDIQLLSDGATTPAIATGFLLYHDTAGVEHQLADWGQHGFGGLIVSGLVGQQPGTIDTTLAAETWHPVSGLGFGANFAAGSPAPRYRFEPMGGSGVVRLAGVVSVTGVTAAAATMFTLPAGYHPANSQSFVTTNSTGSVPGGSVSVTTGGVVQCAPASAGGDAVFLDGITFPLD